MGPSGDIVATTRLAKHQLIADVEVAEVVSRVRVVVGKGRYIWHTAVRSASMSAETGAATTERVSRTRGLGQAWPERRALDQLPIIATHAKLADATHGHIQSCPAGSGVFSGFLPLQGDGDN